MRSVYSILSPESKDRPKIHGDKSPNPSSKDPTRKAASAAAQRASSSRRKCRRVFRIRMRVAARLHFLDRLREMCVRLVLGSGRSRCRNVCDSPKPDQQRHRQAPPPPPPPHKQQQQQQAAEICVSRSSYCEDAVSECIKFIKQTAVAADSRSLIC